MKHVNYLTKVFLFVSICLMQGACSNDDIWELEQETSVSESSVHTMKMELIGDVIGFDQISEQVKTQSRASSSWSNGDKIYITFYNGSNIVPGEATYNSSSGWSVSYDGNLGTGSRLKCEARYFVNATSSSSSLVSLNSHTEIYEDLNGTYAYGNGTLTVQATLVPKTGRIRFIGGSYGTKIYTTGLSVYTTFSPEINKFSYSSAMITSTVGLYGQTPYIYGWFSDSDCKLGLVGSNYAYTRICTSDMLKAGESGYMAIPSENSHNNWRSGLYVKASGVEFKMIPVVGLSSGFFLIGETEVTEALYNKVNGTSSSSLLPVSSITYSKILSTIEKINNETKLNFSLPTAEQWQYAAKGGNKSQGYIYSGSNTPGDVAWYSANASTKQHVKTKSPNELGIYDMSGNVGEFVSNSLSSSSEKDIFGGGYCSNVSYVTNTSYVTTNYGTSSAGYGTFWSYDSSTHNNSEGVGFRLILTCP